MKFVFLSKAYENLTVSSPLRFLSNEFFWVFIFDEWLEAIFEESDLPEIFELWQVFPSLYLINVDYYEHLFCWIIYLFLLATENVEIVTLCDHGHAIEVDLLISVFFELWFPSWDVL